MSKETFVETYWRARAARNAKEAERYKAMADELAEALREIFSETSIGPGGVEICQKDDFLDEREALAKYDAMKGEE